MSLRRVGTSTLENCLKVSDFKKTFLTLSLHSQTHLIFWWGKASLFTHSRSAPRELGTPQCWKHSGDKDKWGCALKHLAPPWGVQTIEQRITIRNVECCTGCWETYSKLVQWIQSSRKAFLRKWWWSNNQKGSLALQVRPGTKLGRIFKNKTNNNKKTQVLDYYFALDRFNQVGQTYESWNTSISDLLICTIPILYRTTSLIYLIIWLSWTKF